MSNKVIDAILKQGENLSEEEKKKARKSLRENLLAQGSLSSQLGITGNNNLVSDVISIATEMEEIARKENRPLSEILQRYSLSEHSPIIQAAAFYANSGYRQYKKEQEKQNQAVNAMIIASVLESPEKKREIELTSKLETDFSQRIRQLENRIIELEKENKKLKQPPLKRGNFNLQTKPAGRHVDPCNPTAFQIMNDGDSNADIRALKYWCDYKKIENPNKDDMKAFKAAMTREAKRQVRNRGTKLHIFRCPFSYHSFE